MKKKLAVVSIIALIMMTLCACGRTPTETADTFMTAIKERDSDTLKTVYSGESLSITSFDKNSEDELEGTLEKALEDKLFDFDYKLSDEKIDGDKATVKVTITTYNLGNAVSEFMTEYFSQAITLAFGGASDEDIEKLAQSLITKHINAAEKDYTGTATIHLTKGSDGWKVDKIDDDGELINEITGGFMAALNEFDDSTESE